MLPKQNKKQKTSNILFSGPRLVDFSFSASMSVRKGAGDAGGDSNFESPLPELPAVRPVAGGSELQSAPSRGEVMCRGRFWALAQLVEDWDSEDGEVSVDEEGAGGSNLELGSSQRRPPAATLDGIVQHAEELGGSLRHRICSAFTPGGRGSRFGSSPACRFARLGDAREPRRRDGGRSRSKAAHLNWSVVAATLLEAETESRPTKESVSQGRTDRRGLGRLLLGQCMLGRRGGGRSIGNG
jgi:hypothetical protein